MPDSNISLIANAVNVTHIDGYWQSSSWVAESLRDGSTAAGIGGHWYRLNTSTWIGGEMEWNSDVTISSLKGYLYVKGQTTDTRNYNVGWSFDVYRWDGAGYSVASYGSGSSSHDVGLSVMVDGYKTYTGEILRVKKVKFYTTVSRGAPHTPSQWLHYENELECWGVGSAIGGYACVI